MNNSILTNINKFSKDNIINERIQILSSLIDYIQEKVNKKEQIRLNFICTHNSRRSHLSQIWAQTMAYHFGIKDIYCYSGGTEATEIFPKITEILIDQGFQIKQLSYDKNPVFTVKFDPNEAPIICFSKIYNDEFNPKSKFGAIMTCDHADQGCPLVLGAEARFPIKYIDPKSFDGTVLMNEKYARCSLDIGEEMWFVFSQIKLNNTFKS